MRKTKPAALAVPAFALLIAAFGIYALRFSHAAAWRLPAEDRPWVDRTLDAAAAVSGRTREELRRTTRPRLWNRPGQVCVMLRSHRKHGDGSYSACFDRRTGDVVEERELGSSFGPRPIADPLWELIW
jgi:hypothetical protein